MFEIVDTNWKEIISTSVCEPKALLIITKENILEKLKSSVLLLDKIYKGLNSYLELKRIFFPRFYFLSNDELLEILSETKDPLKVQGNLKKCFEGIKKLCFNAHKEIEGMQSAENEVVLFIEEVIPQNANGLVEIWIKDVEEAMRQSLKMQGSKAIAEYKSLTRSELIQKFPGQIVLTVSLIYWTSEVTEAIDLKNGLAESLKESNQKLEDLVIMVRNNLNKTTRITVEALIVLDVHG